MCAFKSFSYVGLTAGTVANMASECKTSYPKVSSAQSSWKGDWAWSQETRNILSDEHWYLGFPELEESFVVEQNSCCREIFSTDESHWRVNPEAEKLTLQMSMKNEAGDYQDDVAGPHMSMRLCWGQLEVCQEGLICDEYYTSFFSWHYLALILCIWMFCLCVYLYTICVSRAWGDQKRVSDPPGLELQTDVCSGTQTLSHLEEQQAFGFVVVFLFVQDRVCVALAVL